MRYLEVTAAIIHNEGKYLIAQRPYDKSLGGKWEFPGGKVQDGETLEHCLIREIQEELELIISINQHFVSVRYADDTATLNMHSYICSIVGGNLTLNEHIDYRWVSKNELTSYDFPQVDKMIISKLNEQDQAEGMFFPAPSYN